MKSALGSKQTNKFDMRVVNVKCSDCTREKTFKYKSKGSLLVHFVKIILYNFFNYVGILLYIMFV